MIQTALIGLSRQWYSQLPLEIKKNWQAFCREFQKTVDNQKWPTQAKLLLESTTRASGEEIKTPLLRIEKMARKAYVNNAPNMRNAQMNDARARALDPQLAPIALKNIPNHKSATLEPQLPFPHLIEKIHQKDITRTHTDRHKLSTNSTFSSSINMISLDIDIILVDDVRTTEEYFAYGINVVRDKYSINPNFKGKPFFLSFAKKFQNQDTAFPLAPIGGTQNHLKNLVIIKKC